MPVLHSDDITVPDPRLERAMRQITVAGVLLVLVLALPLARSDSIWLGALPLWLIGMPLSSWWALHHFRLPGFASPAVQVIKPRRRSTAQARRRPGVRSVRRIARAA